MSDSIISRLLAANAGLDFRIFHILAKYFHETHGSLNFLTVYSCSQQEAQLMLTNTCMTRL